jgi:hypothetical protein
LDGQQLRQLGNVHRDPSRLIARPARIFALRILCKRIEWISGINKRGAAHSEQSVHLTDRFGDNDVGLAGLKLVL